MFICEIGKGRGCTDDDRLAILGLPDIWEGKADLPAAVESTELRSNQEWILLSHQPGEFDEARDISPVRNSATVNPVEAGRHTNTAAVQ